MSRAALACASLFPLPSSLYSISPPRSNLARVSAITRSSPFCTSGGTSRRPFMASASPRIDSNASMKFPFFSLPVSSAIEGFQRQLIRGLRGVVQQNELRIVLADLPKPCDQVGHSLGREDCSRSGKGSRDRKHSAILFVLGTVGSERARRRNAEWEPCFPPQRQRYHELTSSRANT